MTDTTLTPIVDTHHHLWDLSLFRLRWLAGLDALDRSFVLADYDAARAGTGIDRSVYMEVDVAEDQRRDEVAYIAGLCADGATTLEGAVVSGRPADDGFAEWVAFLQDHASVRGVRQVLHVPDAAEGACLQPDFVAGVQRLGEAGLLFDVCLRPAELADAARLAERCPDTTLVLDHCGNGDPSVIAGIAEPADGPFAHTADDWRRSIDLVGARPNVVCKISGIVARAPKVEDLADLLAPTIDHCLDAFGPERVVFGGDWPVCTLGAPLADWIAALRAVVAGRPADQQAALFAGNAERIYRLG